MTELGALPRRCGQRSRAEGVEKTGSIMGTSTAPEAQRTRLPPRVSSAEEAAGQPGLGSSRG